MKAIVALVLLTAVVSYGEDALNYFKESPQLTCSPPKSCPPLDCKLPNCKCSGNETAVPDTKSRPQIVYLTFDDALTNYAHENFYFELFNDSSIFTNPDGCVIRATHFLTAQYTDFRLVNKYWKLGHEMASHSITHRSNQTYWATMNMDEWKDEMNGMRVMAAQFANIPFEHIVGTRAPFLQLGGDDMYQMLMDNKFLYDCSWTSRAFGYLNLASGLYPYTMDYRSVQDCQIDPCPTCSFPDLWVQPMLDLEDMWDLGDGYGQPCSMLDGCIIPNNPTPENVKTMLMKNFDRVYNGNRAPFGLYMHAGWFFGENAWHFEGYKLFLEEILKNDDVWVVPISDGLDYIRNYDTYNSAAILEASNNGEGPFTCMKLYNDPVYESRICGGRDNVDGQSCRFPNVSNADIHNQERYMQICVNKWENGQNVKQNCPDPERYPWLGDPCGGNTPCTDHVV